MVQSDSENLGRIANSSIGEGLDFACNLLAKPIAQIAESHSDLAPMLLRTLTQYITLRYVGEDQHAFEYLIHLAADVGDMADFRSAQFWLQMKWVAQKLGIPIDETEDGGLTNRCS